jgi:hypothetical protein
MAFKHLEDNGQQTINLVDYPESSGIINDDGTISVNEKYAHPGG